MKRTSIPHVDNLYKDEYGWTVKVIMADYIKRIALIETVSIGTTGSSGSSYGAFYQIFKDFPDQNALVDFNKLRTGNVKFAGVDD